MKNKPKTIYLQVGEDIDSFDDFKNLDEVTWCADKINSNDLAYSLSSQWISVNDRLPDNDRQVIVHAPNCTVIGPVLIGEFFDDDGSWSVHGFHDTKMNELVTHWMEIVLPY